MCLRLSLHYFSIRASVSSTTSFGRPPQLPVFFELEVLAPGVSPNLSSSQPCSKHFEAITEELRVYSADLGPTKCEPVLRYLFLFRVIFLGYFVGCFIFVNIFIYKGLALISFLSYICLDHKTMPHLPPGGFPMVSTWSHWLIHRFESCLFPQSYFKRYVHRSFQVSATNNYIFRIEVHTHYGFARGGESDR